jgi:hypothetical protein
MENTPNILTRGVCGVPRLTHLRLGRRKVVRKEWLDQWIEAEKTGEYCSMSSECNVLGPKKPDADGKVMTPEQIRQALIKQRSKCTNERKN